MLFTVLVMKKKRSLKVSPVRKLLLGKVACLAHPSHQSFSEFNNAKIRQDNPSDSIRNMIFLLTSDESQSLPTPEQSDSVYRSKLPSVQFPSRSTIAKRGGFFPPICTARLNGVLIRHLRATHDCWVTSSF